MEELELTWTRAIKIWWSLVWRLMVYSMVLGLLISLPIGLLAAALGLDEAQTRMLSQGMASLLSLLLGIWVLRVVLSKHYSDFRVMLVPSDEALLKQRAGTAKPGEDE